MRRTTFEATKTGQIKMQREELLQPMKFREGIGQAESKWFPLLNERRIATTVEPLVKFLRLRSERPGDVPPPFCPYCFGECSGGFVEQLGEAWVNFIEKGSPPVLWTALVTPDFLLQFILRNKSAIIQRSIEEDRQIAHTCIDNPILPCANPFCGHKPVSPLTR